MIRYSLLVLILACTTSGLAQTVLVIEPDDFADGTLLNTRFLPVVELSTGAFSDNRPTFDVRSSDQGGLGHASTGDRVFSHAGGIGFWSSIRTFRMDFPTPPQSIEIDYISSGFSDESYQGRLEAYNSAGVLLDFTETALLAEGQFETLALSTPGIAYALAYPPTDPFGDLDNLRITIPEPASIVLLASLMASANAARRRR